MKKKGRIERKEEEEKMLQYITSATILFSLCVVFFLGFDEVHNFRVDAPHPTYYFDPVCNSSVVTDEVLSIVPCPKFANPFDSSLVSNETVAQGCVYSYINPSSSYYNLHNKPWFGPLAVFTILVLAGVLLAVILLLFSFLDYCCQTYCEEEEGKKPGVCTKMSLHYTGLPIIMIAIAAISILFTLCYYGYSQAIDIRKCSPYLSGIESVSGGVDNGFENIIAGCQIVIQESSSLALMNRLKSLVDSETCTNLFYLEEVSVLAPSSLSGIIDTSSMKLDAQSLQQQLAMTIPVMSTPLLRQKLDQAQSNIDTLALAVNILIGIACALIIVSFIQCFLDSEKEKNNKRKSAQPDAVY